MIYTDIVSDTRWIVGANATSYPIADLTRNVNRHFDEIVGAIFNSGGRWQSDDSNQTDYPIATAALVSGQQDYVLDVTHLKIHRVEYKDENGDWHKLKQFDPKELPGTALTDYKETDGISPEYYDFIANSLFLLSCF